MFSATAPIGIYDSGLGGLTVVRQLQAQFPHESFIYVADTARVPYGGRHVDEIRDFSLDIIRFLAAQQVKAILCACNTSSVVILPEWRRYQGIPVLGLAQAGALTPRGLRRVALLATEATVRSQLYRQHIARYFPEIELMELACPEFVPLVEAGRWQGSEVEVIVHERLKPVLAWQPEAVILGCSHYPYLSRALQTVLGADIRLLDPAYQLIKQLGEVLDQRRLHTPYLRGAAQFVTSGAPSAFAPLAERYLGTPLAALGQHDLGRTLTALLV
ncbi:MAG: glutamate racemase [Candidatus Sericytochromatia bacterium]